MSGWPMFLLASLSTVMDYLRVEFRGYEDVTPPEFVDGEDFCVGLVVEIGIRGEQGADLFYLTACSPSEITAIADQGPRWMRSRIVTKELNYRLAWDFIDRLCRRTSGKDWDEIARKLVRFMDWEFMQ